MTAVAAGTSFGLPGYVVARLCQVFDGWPEISAVWLYGSRAKGTFRKASDIDLCVQADGLVVTDLLKIEGEVDDLLLPWKVDLSLWHQIDAPDLRDHIRRVGVDFCRAGAVSG